MPSMIVTIVLSFHLVKNFEWSSSPVSNDLVFPRVLHKKLIHEMSKFKMDWVVFRVQTWAEPEGVNLFAQAQRKHSCIEDETGKIKFNTATSGLCYSFLCGKQDTSDLMCQGQEDTLHAVDVS